MNRLIQKKLQQWAVDKWRKPLIIRGARQVGKTFAIAELGTTHFKNHVVVVNFEKNADLCRLFEANLDVIRIVAELEIATNAKIEIGKTLLFFDEIQACPKAITALRYFYEELPNLHVVAAGSLLEFALGEISFPVGRVQFLNMYPLGFIEFLWALGHEPLAERLLEGPSPTSLLLSPTIHEKLLGLLKTYFFVGGMPEAVQVYVKSQSLKESFAVHEELILAYQQDFSKYKPAVDPACLSRVLKSVAKNVGQQIKYTNLADEFSSPTIKKAFELLHKAKLITKVSATSPGGLPLGTLASSKRTKAILIDIGLMHYLSGLSLAEEWSKKDLLAIYHGALAEQFVGQELRLAQDSDLYYWSRAEKSSSAEVDYLLVKEGQIYPVEVKAGASGHLKSLHLLLQTFPNCPSGYVFSEAPFAEIKKQKLVFAPLYYVYQVAMNNQV